MEKTVELNGREFTLADLKESLRGYELQISLEERKIEIFNKRRSIIKNNIHRLEPVFAYEAVEEYWECQRDLHDLEMEEKIYNSQMIINTVEKYIESLKIDIKTLEGELK